MGHYFAIVQPSVSADHSSQLMLTLGNAFLRHQLFEKYFNHRDDVAVKTLARGK